MSAREEILNGKHDILKNLADKKPNIVEQLYENYLDFAKANWNYAAQSGKQTADDLLNGTGRKNVACGTIREGLKMMIRTDLK